MRRLHGTLPPESGCACDHEGDGGDPEEIPEGTVDDAVILSGMSNLEQVEDNLHTFQRQHSYDKFLLQRKHI